MATSSHLRIWTPPNVLSFVRLLGAGFLPPVLASGRERAFLWLFVVLVATDWLDGRLARRFAWRSRFGAMLDSVADRAVHLGALIALAWAVPATFLRELPWIVAAIGTYGVAAVLSLLRFRALPGYHTRAAKASWVAVGAGFIALLALDTAWPFRAALGLAVLTNLEILAIAAVLDGPRVDVPSFAEALRLRRVQRARVAAGPAPPRADGRPDAPLTLLHVSDLHFGPPYVARVGEALLQAAAGIDCDAVVVSGDLTQRAKRAQFEEAAAWLARLPGVPRIVVPGNHDVPLYRVVERFVRPLGLYRELIGDPGDRVIALPGAVVVALDSTSPRRAIRNGRIHLDQREFCRQAFRGAPDAAARIVVAHHHFAPAPDYEPDPVLPNARRTLDLFVELGVELVLGGHLHRAFIGNSLDVHPGPSRAHGITILQCGTSTSRRGRGREREKNTFNVVRIEPERIVLEHHMYFEDLGGFRRVSEHAFARAAARHLPDGP